MVKDHQIQTTIFFLLLISLTVFLLIGKEWFVLKLSFGSDKIYFYHQCSVEEEVEFPHFCRLMESVRVNPIQASKNLYEFAKNAGTTLEYEHMISGGEQSAQKKGRTLVKYSKSSLESQLPSVLAHGMGDSCFNSGMISITERVSQFTGAYATCIPTADNVHDDTMNGYFLNMEASIEVFAEAVKGDIRLQNGFNAVGFSQGNNLIRGYIARYNDPPVVNFISINGVNAGIGAVPYCIPKFRSLTIENTKICNALMETASHRAYSSFAQKHSFQANYWRDPRISQKENYLKFSQLARLNNEVLNKNETLNRNYAKTTRFVWVMAIEDRVVWPPEGEVWGAPDPSDPFKTILPMNETEWYIQDYFGLKTADEEGRNVFESFTGNHLQFSLDDFDRWIDTYFKNY